MFIYDKYITSSYVFEYLCIHIFPENVIKQFHTSEILICRQR
jgi:hypothetical protein